MKIMNVFRIIFASAVMIAVPLYAASKSNVRRVQSPQRRALQRGAESPLKKIEVEIAAQGAVKQVTQVRKDLEAVILEEAQKTVDAIMEKNKALRAVALNAVSPDVVKPIIKQQDIIIAEIKQNLPVKARAAGMVIDETELEAGYFSQFFTSVKNKLIAGHGSTPLDKYLASAIIVKLQHLKKTANTQFDKQMLDNEIRNQKIITGDAWSRERRALWAGVTALVTLGTLMYFSTPEEASVPEVSVDKTETGTGLLASIKKGLLEPKPESQPEPTLAPVLAPAPEITPAPTLEQIPTSEQKESEVVDKRTWAQKNLTWPLKNVHDYWYSEQPQTEPTPETPKLETERESWTDWYRRMKGTPSVLDEQINQQERLKDLEILEQAAALDEQIKQQEILQDLEIQKQAEALDEQIKQQERLKDLEILEQAEAEAIRKELERKARLYDAQERYKEAVEATQRAREEERAALVEDAKKVGRFVSEKVKNIGSAIYEAIKEPSVDEKK